MLAVLLGMRHMSLVNLLSILSRFLCRTLKKEPHSMRRLYEA